MGNFLVEINLPEVEVCLRHDGLAGPLVCSGVRRRCVCGGGATTDY